MGSSNMWIACTLALFSAASANPYGGYYWPYITAAYPRAWPGFTPITPAFSSYSFSNFPSAFDMPTMPVMPSMQAMPSMPVMPIIHKPSFSSFGQTSSTAKCELIENEPDLEFPKAASHSIGDNLESSKTATYLCNDKNNKRFYFLKTTTTHGGPSSHHESHSGSYYSLSRQPLELGKDLDIEKSDLWEAASRAEKEQNNPFASVFGSNLFNQPKLFSFPDMTFPTIHIPKDDCQKVENLANVNYPEINDKLYKIPGDDFTSKKITYETYTCSSADKKSTYYTLKTIADFTTQKGVKINKWMSVSYPTDSTGEIDLSKQIGSSSGSGGSASMAQESSFSVSY